MADKIVYAFSGVPATKRQLKKFGETVDIALEEELKDLGEATLRTLRANAVGGPSRAIGRGLRLQRRASLRRPGYDVVSTYRNPKDGFDPLNVSRFGHRTDHIVPRKDRGMALILATSGARGPQGDKPGQKGQVALAFKGLGGDTIFRHSSRGFHPTSDWVQEGRNQMAPQISASAGRLGRKITSLNVGR